jgi:hypothetical protein
MLSTTAPNIGCRFQGTFCQPPDLGLNPWAVLYSRFAAKARHILFWAESFFSWFPGTSCQATFVLSLREEARNSVLCLLQKSCLNLGSWTW